MDVSYGTIKILAMKNKLFYLILSTFLISGILQAQPTKVVVRAKAKDAKFIGSSIGGALVIIRNAYTQTILAEGLTEGSTGNTDIIMKQDHERYKPIGEGAAKFEASINLDAPVFVTIEVHAPFAKRQATVISQTQLWLIPGKHIEGDGIIMEIPGFVVDIIQPQTHERLEPNGKGVVEFTANVVMMCGCPIESKGLWDADGFQAEALIMKDGKLIEKTPLNITNKTSTYKASFTPKENGAYEIIATIFDPKTGNSGVDKLGFIVSGIKN